MVYMLGHLLQKSLLELQVLMKDWGSDSLKLQKCYWWEVVEAVPHHLCLQRSSMPLQMHLLIVVVQIYPIHCYISITVNNSKIY